MWEASDAEHRWYEDIGRTLRERRKERGWTIYDVAAAVGTRQSAISRWENGLDRMKAHHYDALRREGLLP